MNQILKVIKKKLIKLIAANAMHSVLNKHMIYRPV